MAFIVAVVLGFVFLDGWLRYALIAGGAAIELAEIAVWLRWRKTASITGIQTMVGMTGTALTDCAPDGQIKVKGQIWNARCPEGVDAGDEVRVTAVDGLRLDVTALGSPRAPSSSDRVPDF